MCSTSPVSSRWVRALATTASSSIDRTARPGPISFLATVVKGSTGLDADDDDDDADEEDDEEVGEEEESMLALS